MRPKPERRRHPRKTCKLRVRLAGTKQLREHYISNLGMGGVFVETLYPLRIGSPVELDLIVGKDPLPLRIRGEVVWVRPRERGAEPGMGVRFVELQERTLDRLKQLLSFETKTQEP